MKWTEEMKRYLREHYATDKSEDIATALNITKGAVVAKASILGLNKPREFFAMVSQCDACKANQFRNGHVPFNKGVKNFQELLSPEKRARVVANQFKKGHLPKNHKPVGTERTTKDGYIERKTQEPNKWELLHRIVWKEHNGEIPKGFNIQFKDGDKTNCTIENLYIISRREQLVTQNSCHTLPKEYAELIQLKGALKRKINRLTNLNK